LFACFFSSRRRHTRSKRDWSSDVCSSDLYGRSAGDGQHWCSTVSSLAFIESIGVFVLPSCGLISQHQHTEATFATVQLHTQPLRSEERRVGKHCMSR